MKDCGSLQRAQKGRETCPFRALDGFNEIRLTLLERMAGTTRLELATSAVTARCVPRSSSDLAKLIDWLRGSAPNPPVLVLPYRFELIREVAA